MNHRLRFSSPIGPLTLEAGEGGLTALYLPNADPPPSAWEATALLREGRDQVLEYFSGARQFFDLPLAPQGTPFQLKVWRALADIPYGQTVTYGALARRVGCPGGARAVGQANHRNPLPILLPCHRVVGAGGALTGYGGGLEVKRFLLKLEGVL